jgi:hypothetical protein
MNSRKYYKIVLQNSEEITLQKFNKEFFETVSSFRPANDESTVLFRDKKDKRTLYLSLIPNDFRTQFVQSYKGIECPSLNEFELDIIRTIAAITFQH